MPVFWRDGSLELDELSEEELFFAVELLEHLIRASEREMIDVGARYRTVEGRAHAQSVIEYHRHAQGYLRRWKESIQRKYRAEYWGA